jgi:hypothetical protein
MQAKGIKVLAQEERQLTEEEAREFYSHLEGEVCHPFQPCCQIVELFQGQGGGGVSFVLM